MKCKILIGTFSFVLTTSSYAIEDSIIVNSNEISSSVFYQEKFVGLTPLKLECSKEKVTKLTVVSSLSGQKFERQIPDCSFLQNYEADKFINIVFDDKVFNHQKENILISKDVNKKRTSPQIRNIASSEVESHKNIGIKKIEEVGAGYYLQFLALPFSQHLLNKSDEVLGKYNTSRSPSSYSYCVKKVLGEEWIRFTLGPFETIKEAKGLREGYPPDSFIQYRDGCKP